jgi:hypothetical protein
MADLVGPDDVLAATDAVVSALEPAIDDAERWTEPAGTLRWSCTATLIHIVDCFVWYAASLARRSTRGIELMETNHDAGIGVLVDSVRSGGAMLAAVVAAAGPDDRGWHLFGVADRSGWAAMGVDEALIHGADLAAGLGVALHPPPAVADHVVRRLFPWAPTEGDPWDRLLWANGRAPLGDLPTSRRWRVHCAPLEEWDGELPTIGGKPAYSP